eukprot:CAMPEP_0184377990 /NCGR_PEP_ID=MMETSP0007-20130409/2722_1 /TAXON_ID=97485 /ORGANISM="Prymnesium parvum, Strain Texoma1" /LENGTH=79 /DNA_ID=CAMNT_0026722095 /DNA_START=91 /DNA_END=330 /DNA_ORIENTATION=-
MDEQGAEHNKGRKKKVGSKDTSHDGLRHCMEVTDADNNPFHVTNCMTTRADGAAPIPPLLGHSNPSTNAAVSVSKVTRK